MSHLRRLDSPSSLSEITPRLKPVEYRPWRFRAKLVGAVLEDDHACHVVIRIPSSPRKTMIIEFPYTRCHGARRSPKVPR